MNFRDSIHPSGELHPSPGAAEQAESTLEHARQKVTVPNSLGLHMRPVMRFVDLAGQFQSRIVVTKDTHVVDGKNPMELMLLEATEGTELEIQADGPDAAQAVEALQALVQSGFGED